MSADADAYVRHGHGFGIVFVEQAADVCRHFAEKNGIGLEAEPDHVELAQALQPPAGRSHVVVDNVALQLYVAGLSLNTT